MPTGIQVFLANGRAILDTNDSITRIVGTVSVGRGSSGGVTLPASQGRPFWNVLSRGATGYTALPNVFMQGNTLFWNYDGVNLNYAADVFIIYGLY